MDFFSGGNGYPGVMPLAVLMLWELSKSWMKGQEYISLKACENRASTLGTNTSYLILRCTLSFFLFDYKCFDVFWQAEGEMNALTLRLFKSCSFYCIYFLKKCWWGAVSLHFFHYAKFQFACSEINVQVRQRNKLAYNLHLKKKISNSVPTLILNIKYTQLITWCFTFLLHFRYRYKQCDIQTSKFTAMSTSLIDFTSSQFLFLEAPYPTASRELVQAVSDTNASQHPTVLPQLPHSRFCNQ